MAAQRQFTHAPARSYPPALTSAAGALQRRCACRRSQHCCRRLRVMPLAAAVRPLYWVSSLRHSG
jgi:hypothetical protein